jgi:hypothetical protein
VTDKEALELSLAMLERDNLKVGNIYVNYDIQKALIKLVKKTLKGETKKKEWQGLTDDEIKEILDCGRPNLVNIKKAEQKLKEKNA